MYSGSSPFEACDASLLHPAIALEKLLARETILRLLRLADDGIAALQRTGIVATAEEARREIRRLRPIAVDSDRVKKIFPMSEVVEVDDRAELPCLAEFLRRRVVRGEHDLLADIPDPLGEDELRHRRAVAAEVELLEELHEMRVRRGLHGEELPEALVPGERLLQAFGVLANCLRVVDVKRSRPPRRNLLELFLGER